MRPASATSRSIVTPKRNVTPRCAACAASLSVNILQSPVSSPGKPQAADELAADFGQRRFGGDAAGRVQHLERHAELFQHLDVAADAGELLVVAEELQRALAALVIGDARRRPQFAQPVAAVFGDRHHARLVDGIARRGAVAQHLEQPRPHPGIERRAHDQRPVAHQQPLDRFQRNARPGPGRGVARRDFAGIGEAGLQSRTGLAIDDRHLVTGLGEIVARW